jgi:regulator of replication initiation timing
MSGEEPPKDSPAWLQKLREELFTKLEGISSSVETLKTEISAISKTADFAVAKAQEAVTIAKQAEHLIKDVRQENSELHRTVDALKNKLVNLELQSRRDNLIFSGVPEKKSESWRDCAEAVQKILKDNFDLVNVKFESVHRLGPKVPQRTRHIIAKFTFHRDL